MEKIKQSILKNGKAMILAYDHGFEHGISDFNDFSLLPENILELATNNGYTGLVLHKGLGELLFPVSKKVPLIIKLNGKSPFLRENDSLVSADCSVKYAQELGAKGVGYTIYLGSQFEKEMIKEFGKIQEEARERNLITILWLYPVSKEMLSWENFTANACRLGLELGADMVKIKYPGSKEELKKARKYCPSLKILLSGGEKLAEEEFLNNLKESLEVGLDGVAVGRNIFQQEDPESMSKKIQEIIFS